MTNLSALLLSASSAVVGGVISQFGLRLNENYKRKVAKREAHLVEIKTRIIEPCWRTAADHWMKMFIFKRSAISVTYVSIPRDVSSVAQNNTAGYRFRLDVKDPAAEQYYHDNALLHPADRPSYNIEEALYLDVRNNHYPRIFARVDKCRDLAHSFQANALTAYQDIEAALRNKIQLPEGSRNTGELRHWMNFQELAKYIGDRALGIEPNHLFSYSDSSTPGMRLRVSGDQRELCNAPDELSANSIVSTIDAQVLSFNKQKIVQMAEEARAPVEMLLLDLSGIRGTDKLPSGCSYKSKGDRT